MEIPSSLSPFIRIAYQGVAPWFVRLLECYNRASHLCSRPARGIKDLALPPVGQVYRDSDLLGKADNRSMQASAPLPRAGRGSGAAQELAGRQRLLAPAIGVQPAGIVERGHRASLLENRVEGAR